MSAPDQGRSATTPTSLREFAAVVENLGPNVLRRCLIEAADTIDLLRNRDAAAQTLIGVLRYKAQQAGDPAGGPDFSLYRQYSDLFPPIPDELGGPPSSGRSINPPKENP